MGCISYRYGVDGKDGINGVDGKDGINGVDGKDGTKMAVIDKALSELPEVTLDGKPNCIICSTQKGQGVSFMEERPSAWHIGGFDDDKLEETLALIDAYTNERLAEVE